MPSPSSSLYMHLFIHHFPIHVDSSIILLQSAADANSSSSASSKPYFPRNVSYSSLQPAPLDSFNSLLSASPTSLHLAPRISTHTTSLFFLLTFSTHSHLLTNCFSCHCSTSPTYPVQPPISFLSPPGNHTSLHVPGQDLLL